MNKGKILFVSTGILIVLILICTMLYKNNTIKEVPQERIVYNSLNEEYKYSEIIDYFIDNEQVYMDPFMVDFNVKQYKSIDDKKYIILNSDVGIITIWYDNKDQLINLKYANLSSEASNDFINAISIGDSLSHVSNLSPDGNYDFLYTSYTKNPEVSYHFFSDGKCYEIHYDNLIITDIFEFTI